MSSSEEAVTDDLLVSRVTDASQQAILRCCCPPCPHEWPVELLAAANAISRAPVRVGARRPSGWLSIAASSPRRLLTAASPSRRQKAARANIAPGQQRRVHPWISLAHADQHAAETRPKHRRNRVNPPGFLRGFLASQSSQPIQTERKKFARFSPQNIRCRPPRPTPRSCAPYHEGTRP
jgi:hypothetical protein